MYFHAVNLKYIIIHYLIIIQLEMKMISRKDLMNYNDISQESIFIDKIYISFLHTHLQVWRVDDSTRIVILMNCRNDKQNQICWKIVTIHELCSPCSFLCFGRRCY